MQKQLPHCFAREPDSVSSLDVTNAPPPGRIFLLSNDEELEIDLWSRHLRNAVRVAETQAARIFPANQVKARTMNSYHLPCQPIAGGQAEHFR